MGVCSQDLAHMREVMEPANLEGDAPSARLKISELHYRAQSCVHKKGADRSPRLDEAQGGAQALTKARLSALTTALIEASSMLVSMPAPKNAPPRSVLIWM